MTANASCVVSDISSLYLLKVESNIAVSSCLNPQRFMCMYVCKRVDRDPSGLCTATSKICCASSSCLFLCKSCNSDEALDFHYGGAMVVP
jgi:hypothetical protein